MAIYNHPLMVLLAFILVVITIGLTLVYSLTGRRAFLKMSAVSGFISGFLAGTAVAIRGIEPGIGSGIALGIGVDMALVGGAVCIRYLQGKAGLL